MMSRLQKKAEIIDYLIIIFILAAFRPNGGQVNIFSMTTHAFPILNVTDVRTIANSPDYATIYIEKNTTFSQSLRGLGYVESSSSLFNFTGALNNFTTFPKTIAIVMFLMDNNTSASEAVNSMIFSNNANQSVQLYIVNNRSYWNYNQYGNTKIYTVRSIAVFNTSVIKSPNSIMPLPDYQYTSIFSYGNLVGTVITDGYTNNLNNTISTKIAEMLLGKAEAK